MNWNVNVIGFKNSQVWFVELWNCRTTSFQYRPSRRTRGSSASQNIPRIL